jgi:hemerythrin-like domain-containing protein
MDVKAGGKKFKGVATEPDRRRSTKDGAATRSGKSQTRTKATAKKAHALVAKGSAARRATPRGTAKTPTKRAASPRRKDALSLLIAEHKEARAMFREYKRLIKSHASDEKKRELAERVCDALTVHARVEEEIFYPAAREAGLARDVMDETEVEHQSAKSLIRQIKAMAPADRTYDAKVTVLSDFVDHHVQEEEGQMFRLCRKSTMELNALGETMRARKAELANTENILIRVARKAIDALLPG